MRPIAAVQMLVFDVLEMTAFECDINWSLEPAPGTTLEEGIESLRVQRNPTRTGGKLYGKSVVRQHFMLAGIP